MTNFENPFADGSSKIGHDFSNKVVQKSTQEKTMLLTKNGLDVYQ